MPYRRRRRRKRQRGGINMEKAIKKVRKALTGQTANNILDYGDKGIKTARKLQRLMAASQIGAGGMKRVRGQRGGFLPALLGMGLLPMAGNALNKLIDKI